jgi:hypothetical protein
MSWYGDAISAYYRNQTNASDILAQGIQSLGQSIGHGIEEARQNSIANQIGSQQANSGAYAPRAALVDPGSNPDLPGTSNYIPGNVPTGGTAPAQFTGGYKGLQLQNAIDSLRYQRANTASEIGLRQAQGEYYGAHTQAIQEQADTARRRANTYQQSVTQRGQRQPQEKLPTPVELSKDIKDLGVPQGWSSVLSGNIPYQRGDLDADGNWKPNVPTGAYYSYGQSPEELAANAAPKDTIDQLQAKFDKMKYGGAQGGGNQPAAAGGGQRLSPQQAAQLPPGTIFTGLDGKQYQVPSNGG